MKWGTSWQDITPDKPVALLGQMHIRLGERKRDPITVNALVIDDEAGGRVALVSIDVCFVPPALLSELLDHVSGACGIARDRIMIAATHTHVAPCTSDEVFGEPDPDFLRDLDRAVTQTVLDAIADLESVEVYAGKGWLDHMGWNRRGLRRDGSCHMYWGSWNEDFVGVEGPRDGDVPVIFSRRADGRIKAVITGFATHPNSVEGESFYSADVPGEVRRVLRGALGQHVGVVYLTGAAGDTAPSIMIDNLKGEQPWRGETGLVRSGLYLGGEILRTIAAQIVPMTGPTIGHERRDLKIAMRQWDPHCDPSTFGEGMRQYYEQSRNAWPKLMREDNPVSVPVHVLRIGDAAICTNPSELYCTFGLSIKHRSPARVTMIAELTDGCVGYIPTPQAIRHGGYSAWTSAGTRLVPDAGWQIVDATTAALGRLFAAR